MFGKKDGTAVIPEKEASLSALGKNERTAKEGKAAQGSSGKSTLAETGGAPKSINMPKSFFEMDFNEVDNAHKANGRRILP